jgi:hypothetical protein
MLPDGLTRRELLALAGSLSLTAWAAAAPRRSPQDPPRKPKPEPRPGGSAYAERVLSLEPVGYWRLQEKGGKVAHDSSPHRRDGAYHGKPAHGEPGPVKGGLAVGFDGKETYVEVPSHADFSQPTHRHGLTVEVWMRPDALTFAGETDDPYVYWLGKGEKDHEEWALRFYSKKSKDRPNRVSAYLFNPSGGLGAGAFFQKAPRQDQWLHVVACYDPGTKADRKAGVTIYRDGERQQGPPASGTLYSNPKFDIVPKAGDAPLRFGTRELSSFFVGGLAEVAIYPRVLDADDVLKNFQSATA